MQVCACDRHKRYRRYRARWNKKKKDLSSTTTSDRSAALIIERSHRGTYSAECVTITIICIYLCARGSGVVGTMHRVLSRALTSVQAVLCVGNASSELHISVQVYNSKQRYGQITNFHRIIPSDPHSMGRRLLPPPCMFGRST